MAKSFKNLISEVAQPKAGEERAFKDQHTINKIDAQPAGQEHIFKGTVATKPRLADYMRGLDQAAYDKAYADKTPFSMPRDIDEDVDLQEDPSEEKPMMHNSLKTAQHYLEGIQKYVAETDDPEEWFQNKLAAAVKEMATLYGYATGKTNEEVELDELEKKTLGSYAKLAADDAAARAGHAMELSAKGDSKGFAKQFVKSRSRLKGAGKAIDKMMQKESADETPKSGGPDHNYTHHVFDYTGEPGEEEHRDMKAAAKERNVKVSTVRGQKHALYGGKHITLRGNKADVKHVMDNHIGPMDESFNEGAQHHDWHVTFKTGHKPQRVKGRNTAEAIKKAEKLAQKSGEKDPRQLAMYKSIKKVSEDLDEAKAKKGKPLTVKQMRRALASAKAAPKDKVSLKKAPFEIPEAVSLEEAVKFNASNLSLDSGEKVKISRQDAQLLTQFFKDLNSRNAREMRKVLMTDKAGFKEILSFAREAL